MLSLTPISPSPMIEARRYWCALSVFCSCLFSCLALAVVRATEASGFEQVSILPFGGRDLAQWREAGQIGGRQCGPEQVLVTLPDGRPQRLALNGLEGETAAPIITLDQLDPSGRILRTETTTPVHAP